MKTIKIIELLNKIANGEDVPQKVKYKDEIYYYEKDETDYFGDDTYLFYKGFKNNVEMFLKDEIEIVEDNKKIEKLSELFYDEEVIKDFTEKINEIIDYINNREN